MIRVIKDYNKLMPLVEDIGRLGVRVDINALEKKVHIDSSFSVLKDGCPFINTYQSYKKEGLIEAIYRAVYSYFEWYGAEGYYKLLKIQKSQDENV